MNLRLVFLYSALFLLTACSHTDKPAAGTDISQILGDDFVGFGAVSKAGAVDPDNDYLHTFTQVSPCVHTHTPTHAYT